MPLALIEEDESALVASHAVLKACLKVQLFMV